MYPFKLEIFPYFKIFLWLEKVKVIMKVVILRKYMMKNEDIVSADTLNTCHGNLKGRDCYEKQRYHSIMCIANAFYDRLQSYVSGVRGT